MLFSLQETEERRQSQMLGKEKLEEKRHNSNFDRLRSSFILYPYM
jgi:hypothetical protein